MNNYFVDISKSLNLKDSSESNVDNIGSNIRHSLKNVLFEDHVSVTIIREKNADPFPTNLNWRAQKANYRHGLR